MFPSSPRSLANGGNQSRPARPGRPSRRCWSRRKSPARSTTVCYGTSTARAGACRGRTCGRRTGPVPGNCHGGKRRPAGAGLTPWPAWGKGTVPGGLGRSPEQAEEAAGCLPPTCWEPVLVSSVAPAARGSPSCAGLGAEEWVPALGGPAASGSVLSQGAGGPGLCSSQGLLSWEGPQCPLPGCTALSPEAEGQGSESKPPVAARGASEVCTPGGAGQGLLCHGLLSGGCQLTPWALTVSATPAASHCGPSHGERLAISLTGCCGNVRVTWRGGMVRCCDAALLPSPPLFSVLLPFLVVTYLRSVSRCSSDGLRSGHCEWSALPS